MTDAQSGENIWRVSINQHLVWLSAFRTLNSRHSLDISVQNHEWNYSSNEHRSLWLLNRILCTKRLRPDRIPWTDDRGLIVEDVNNTFQLSKNSRTQATFLLHQFIELSAPHLSRIDVSFWDLFSQVGGHYILLHNGQIVRVVQIAPPSTCESQLEGTLFLFRFRLPWRTLSCLVQACYAVVHRSVRVMAV